MEDSKNSAAVEDQPVADAPATATESAAPHDDPSLSSFMSDLDEAATAQVDAKAKQEFLHQQKLVMAKLGVASSLFIALRAKHPPSANHSLRVALGVSSWALHLELDDVQRDQLEIAALLHDVGKIGVPDHVLNKPGKLSAEELMAMESNWLIGRDVVSACCGSPEILDTIHYARAWFDGTKHGFDKARKDLPFEARVLAIMDAFDSMTTDSVYRRALSRERAMTELFEYAGTQFDPELVKHFYHLVTNDQVKFCAGVARRWLQQLDPESANQWWDLEAPLPKTSPVPEHAVDNLFHQQLFDSMHDGVIYVNNRMNILLWNRAAERLTGISGNSIANKQWEPALVGMHCEKGKQIDNSDCPVAYAIWSGVQGLRRLSIKGRNGNLLSVDVHVAPVFGVGGEPQGATVILHDASSQISLEQSVDVFKKRATLDPLTQVSNRAEFDQAHEEFVEQHLKLGVPFSLIICDIDHFKKVNDTYGHQAGDDVLVSFATLLKRFCRSGDLVARYGGEEFVILCADCDNASATNLAEKIRKELAATPQEALGNSPVTCSIGVTEVQNGDTAETMLRRADRALYQAKDGGRNQVVQLGSGLEKAAEKKSRAAWFHWFQNSPAEMSIERRLITAVPLKIAAEKLRGFVADHAAQIESIKENHVVLKLTGEESTLNRRRHDRPLPFFIEMNLEEVRVQLEGRRGGSALRTLCHVFVRPSRQRDRRRADVMERGMQIVSSLKSYLMAQEFEAGDPDQR